MVVMQAGSVDRTVIRRATESLHMLRGTRPPLDLPSGLPLRYYLEDTLHLQDHIAFG